MKDLLLSVQCCRCGKFLGRFKEIAGDEDLTGFDNDWWASNFYCNWCDDYTGEIDDKSRKRLFGKGRVMNEYEQKQQARKEWLLRKADKEEQESKRRLHSPNNQILREMMGQPILVGHHSEKRHRNLIKRADNDMRKGIEASDKAKRLRDQAAAVGSGGVSSDDPEAIEKLKSKLARLEKNQNDMKAANKIIKSKKLSREEKLVALQELGAVKCADRLLEPVEDWRDPGFPRYALTNNNANIRRIKARIEELERMDSREAKVEEREFFRVEECPDDNRIRLFFPGIPSPEVRKVLKSYGWRWSPSNEAWQRMLNNAGRHSVGTVEYMIKEAKS